MYRTFVVSMLFVTLMLAACKPIEPVVAVPTEADPVANALSAGPSAITAGARVVDWPPEGESDWVELRAGSNEWTCVTDVPFTPINDPLCLDEPFMAWLNALLSGEEYAFPRVSFSYLLQGGYDNDPADPYAAEPPAGKKPLISPPSMMIGVPGDLDPTVYSTDPADGIYIMYEGTPYEHLMVPVADMP